MGEPQPENIHTKAKTNTKASIKGIDEKGIKNFSLNRTHKEKTLSERHFEPAVRRLSVHSLMQAGEPKVHGPKVHGPKVRCICKRLLGISSKSFVLICLFFLIIFNSSYWVLNKRSYVLYSKLSFGKLHIEYLNLRKVYRKIHPNNRQSSQPVRRAQPNAFPHLYVWSGIWKTSLDEQNEILGSVRSMKYAGKYWN